MQILGRFGWKADAATVREIAERALTSELGLSSLSALSEAEREDLYFYARELAVVAREFDLDSAAHGFELFESTGCAGCHRPSYVIDRVVSDKPFRTEIWPFTDLLLHDMGPRLEGAGSGAGGGDTEWRTPPLWGIGRTLSAHGRNAYLHDGRAKTVHEAILWHGGEGEAARSQYLRLAPNARRALVNFVESL